MAKRVLIVEDDEAMARLLADNLVFEHFEVQRASGAAEVQRTLKTFKPDIVLLDLMLAEGDGFEICRSLGEQRERPPIIILSARSSQDDKIRGLDLGADDYVTKPFAFKELLARMRAVVRRRNAAGGVLHLGSVVIDFHGRRATRNGRDLGLSYREFEVLQFLAERPGRVVTRDELLEEVWGYREMPLTRSVDISIVRLRRKIEIDPHKPRFIRTLHGEGYSLTPDG
jgi:two-component system, OmpR family, alkaline phosphatase synthesis response regulator PhoP